MKMNSKVHTLTGCALMAAAMCALCPLSIPIGPVPVSLSILVIMLTVYLLGTRNAAISYIVYLLLGAVGMPVFSGFQGGLAKLAGPTGGYLIGFLPMLIISGLFIHKSKGNLLMSLLGMVIGVAVDYVFGTVWFVLMMKCDVGHALAVCVYPFIAVDLAKIVVAALFGTVVHKALQQANLLPEAAEW